MLAQCPFFQNSSWLKVFIWSFKIFQKLAKTVLDTKDNVLYAKGYLYPMSPSLLNLKPDVESDDEIVEIEVSFNKDCKKSCLSKGFEW